MNIKKIAEKAEGAVRVGDALGKSDDEIKREVHGVIGHLSVADMDAVVAHIADSDTHDNR